MLSVALAFLALFPNSGSQVAIQNPGFEFSPPLTGWDVQTRSREEHGRAPTLTIDREDAKEGTQSLLIEARTPRTPPFGRGFSCPSVLCGARGRGLRPRAWLTKMVTRRCNDHRYAGSGNCFQCGPLRHDRLAG